MKKEAIIITIPNAFWKEYPGGREAFDKIMEHVDAGKCLWNQTISAIPKNAVYFVYFIINGKIELRLTIYGVQANESKTFDGGRTYHNKNWVVLSGPVVKAPKEYPMRGFQGFRYTEFIF